MIELLHSLHEFIRKVPNAGREASQIRRRRGRRNTQRSAMMSHVSLHNQHTHIYRLLFLAHSHTLSNRHNTTHQMRFFFVFRKCHAVSFSRARSISWTNSNKNNKNVGKNTAHANFYNSWNYKTDDMMLSNFDEWMEHQCVTRNSEMRRIDAYALLFLFLLFMFFYMLNCR